MASEKKVVRFCDPKNYVFDITFEDETTIIKILPTATSQRRSFFSQLGRGLVKATLAGVVAYLAARWRHIVTSLLSGEA